MMDVDQLEDGPDNHVIRRNLFEGNGSRGNNDEDNVIPIDNDNEKYNGSPIQLTERRVYFGDCRCYVDSIELADVVVRFSKVTTKPGSPRFNITIPLAEIAHAGISCENEEGSSFLIIYTVPESGAKITAALSLDRTANQSYPDDGSLRIIIEHKVLHDRWMRLIYLFFRKGDSPKNLRLYDGDEALRILKQVQERERITQDYNNHHHLPNHHYQQKQHQHHHQDVNESPTRNEEAEIEQIIPCSSSLNNTSLNSTVNYSPPVLNTVRLSRHSSPRVYQLTMNQRLRSCDNNNVPSIIDIDIDDDEDGNNADASTSSMHDSDECVVTYPPDEPDAITIYKSDLACLEEEEFLNDTILDFYLKYIQKELIERSYADKTYIFSTYFYSKLTEKKKDEDPSLPITDRIYNRVKNWTKNIDIFEKDFLIITINRHHHWFLAIICYPGLAPDCDEILPIDISEANPKKFVPKPCILYMDSLQNANSRSGLSGPLRHFLAKEWEIKKKSKKNFTRPVMPDYFLKVPAQQNYTDCGLFVLQYIESFLRNPQYVLMRVRQNLENTWFSNSLITAKRKSIKRLIKRFKDEADEKKLSTSKLQLSSEQSSEPADEDVEIKEL